MQQPAKDSDAKSLGGIIPPLATPVTDDERVDEDGLKRLVERVIEGGVSGLFVLGSTSEFPALPEREKQSVIDVVTQTAHGRVKVVVNVSEPGLSRTLPIVRMAERAQADAIGLIAPYYFPMEDAEILDYYRLVDSETDLPILVYNFPKLSKITMRPELVEELIETTNVLAVKDSSAQMVEFRQFIALSEKYQHFSALVASMPLLAMAATYGADGAITGMANIAPRLMCDLFQSAKSGDVARAVELQRRADRLMAVLRVGGAALAAIRGVKSALVAMGVFKTGRFVRPYLGHTDDEAAQVRTILERENLL